MEPFCTLGKENLLAILHNLLLMKEIFESKMTMFNERERTMFFASKNKIHAILEEASKALKRGLQR